MNEWTTALTEAANLSGWDLRNVANGHESKFIGSIIKQVLQEVNQSPLDVAWHPVGVDSHVEDIELLLQSGSGSLIIITTRDRHLLCGLRENEIYEAKLLNDNEAMQLFSCHAFNSLFPPHEYVELAQDIIKYSGALPLALVTLGSHLHGRSLEEWKYEFKKLRGIPHSDIQKILKLSFDGLDGDTQSACFLDIACAFDGFFVDEVTKTLNACGFYSESAIATLVERHLLQRDGRRLVMHDLVRNMGREIVRMESPRDPGKWSRLFNPQEVRDVLQEKKRF